MNHLPILRHRLESSRKSHCLRWLRAHARIPGAACLILCLLTWGSAARGATGTWNQTGAGTFNWTDAANWLASTVPNASGDIANLNLNLTAAQTITLNSPVSLGTLNLGDTTTGYFGQTIAGASTLTFNNGGTGATITKATAGNTAIDTISANILMADTLTLNNAATAATGAILLSGNISDGGAGWALQKTGAGLVTLAGNNSFSGPVSISAGNLMAVNPAALDSSAATNITLSGGSLDLRANGDGTQAVQSINFGDDITMSGSAAITVDRIPNLTGPTFITPLNKTLQLRNLTIGTQTLTVTPASGYGLEFTGGVALNDAATFSVGGTQASNVVPGLTITGVIDDGASDFGFTKTGTGTLVLANTANTFGFGNVITVSGGILQGNGEGSFGDLSNAINITANSLTQGVRFNYSGTTSRTIRGNAASVGLDVTRGNTITLANPLDFSTAGNNLGKNDAGRLILAAGAPTIAGAPGAWNGAITVSQGALQVSGQAALGGAAATTLSGTASTLELANAGPITDPINISNGNQTNKGWNAFGNVQGITGTSTLTGTIALTSTLGDNQRSTVIVAGVKNGAVLNLSGVTNSVTFNNPAATTNRNFDLYFISEGSGLGTINTPITNLGGITNRQSFRVAGTGTWNATAASFFGGTFGGATTAQTAVYLTAGTFELSGAGTFGAVAAGDLAGRVDVSSNGLFRINESTSDANRLNNRQMRLLGGGDLYYVGGNAADTSENIGQQVAFNLDRGQSIINIDASATNSATLNTGTVGAVTRSNLATLKVNGDNIGSAAGAGVGVLVGGNAAGGFTFIGQTGATATTTKSIVPWVLVENAALPGGIGFGTSDSAAAATTTGTNVVRGLAASESLGSVAALIAANTASNVTLSANDMLDRHLTMNSLRLDGGSDLDFCGAILTLDSGGFLATGSTSTTSNGYLTTSANRDVIVHALGDAVLNTPVVGTTGGLAKTGDGVLTIGTRASYTGETSVQGGTMVLAGGANTLAPNQNLFVQEGAKLDLNGNNQYAGLLLTGGAEITARGAQFAEVTSASPAILTIGTGNVNFNGKITGSLTLARGQATGSFQDWNLWQPLTYTGPTILTGGRVQMLDDATLLNTSRIDIQNATLLVSNGTYTSDTPANRISDTAPINLTAGMLQFRAPQGASVTEVMGQLNLGAGMSLLDPAEAGGGVNAAHMEFAALNRIVAQHGTLRFDGNVNGAIGSTSNVYFTSAPAFSNNILGGWAVFDRDFATYTGMGGVTPLQNAGAPGYNRTNYTDATTNGINAALSGENIRMTGTGTAAAGHSVTLSGNKTMNALAYIPQNTAGTATFNLNGNTLTLESGGLSLSPNANSDTPISLSVTGGSITAGAPGAGGELFVHHLPFPGADNLERRSVNLGATITDNAGGPVTLVLNSQNHGGGTARRSTLYLTGDNDHTGGTWVNSGRIVLNTAGANGSSVAAIPGDLTIIGGIQQNTNGFDGNNTVQLGEVFAYSTGQIATTSNVTMKGSSRLDFSGAPAGITASPNAVIGATIASLTFDNTGGQAPAVNLGNGNLVINGNIVAGGANVGSTATSVISRSGTGVIDFGGVARTIQVTPVTVDGTAVNDLLPNLNINAPITNAASISKTGNGILQLSAQSTFNGSLNLNAGGIMVGGSSTPATRPDPAVAPVLASGPLGTGPLNIAAGTSLLSSAAANAVGNAVSINGNFTFNGTNSLTLNGDANLGGANRTIGVTYWQMNATLGGVVSNGSITKVGNGTLTLANNNTFTGGVTLNAGTLVGQLPGAGVSGVSPFGTGAIAYNGGYLSMRTQSGDAIFGNHINVNSALEYVFFDVQGGSQVTMGNLNMPLDGLNNPTVSLVNIGGTTGSTLKFNSTNLDLNGDGGVSLVRIAGQYQSFNIASGVTTIFVDPFCRNNEPLNVGQGTLLLSGANCFTNASTINSNGYGAAPLANATTAIYGTGQTVNLSGGTVASPLAYTIVPQTNAVIPGSVTGGLDQSATNVASGNLNIATTWGKGITSSFLGDMPNDAALDRVLHTNAAISTLGVYNGYLNITTEGVYEFLLGSDDFSALVIDGVEVARDITTGHGVNDTARGSIYLAAGQHAITFKINTGTNTPGGGGRLLYMGPDTALNGTNGTWQAIDPSRLSYFTGPANAGNNFYNAAQIDNDYTLSAGSVFTLAGNGADYNSTIKSLTMGAGSQLNVTNDAGTASAGGTGFIGVKGVTNVTAGAAVLNPTTANLYLIGGINDGGAGLQLASTATGTLSLNNSSSFTGAFAINGGTVVLRETNALSTGANTVASGASIDVFGVGSSAGRNITINGAGTASQIGAIYNSQAATATVAGNVTLATNSQIAGYGDIVIDGTVTSAAGVALTKAGSDVLTLTASNSASLLGPVTVAAGMLNNGTLNSGTAGALGVGAINVSASAILNLNGNNISQAITANGGSRTNYGPNGNSFGNIINSSVGQSVATRNAVTPGFNMMQLPNTAGTATISGSVTFTAGTGIGSNTYATGGDIIVTGTISGTGSNLTKRGGNTVFLRNTMTYTGGTNVDTGRLVLDGAGTLNAGGNINVQTGAELLLNNGTTFTNNRLNNNVAGNNKIVTLNGGVLTIVGSGSTADDTTELISASVAGGNTSALAAGQGLNVLNLTPNAAGGSVALTLTKAGTGLDLTNANAGTLLINGRNLGAGTPADGNASLLLTNALTTGGLNIIGQNSNTANGGANNIAAKGIAPWAIVDDGANVHFATVSSTAGVGVRALGVGNATEITTGALTAAANVTLGASLTSTVNTAHSINSLKMTAGTLTLQQGTNLNLNSGGILATGSATIAGPGIISADGTPVASGTAGAQNLYLWAYGSGTTLTVNAAIGSPNNNTGRVGEIVKAGSGVVVLGGSNFAINNVRVQEGTLRLNNASALYYRPVLPAGFLASAGSNSGQTVQVNGGGILDLNGFNAPINNLNSINPAGATGSLSGGTILNGAAGTAALSINTTAGNTWAGNISSGTGAINVNKYGRDTFTVVNSNTYTGATLIGGGRTTVIDLGAFRGTSAITINQAALFWDDTGSQSDQYRLGTTPAPITLNGGGLTYSARNGEAGVANVGNITLASGASSIQSNANTLGSATIHAGILTRSGNATVSFSGSILGDDGNIRFTTVPALNNGILGGWAISSAANPYTTVGAGDFVTNDPVTGIRAIVDYKTTAGIAYPSGNSNQPALAATAFGAGNNILVNGNTTMNPGNNVVNSMVIGVNANIALSFAGPTDTLFVQSGGILGRTDGNSKTIGGNTVPSAVNQNGYITVGNSDGTAGAGNPGYELFLHNLGNTMIVNSQIVDNGASPVTLVTSVGGQVSPAIRFNNRNTYTGPTIINSGDIRLNSAVGPAFASSTAITINGAAEIGAGGDTGRQAASRILFEQANQLNTGATVTINSGAANLDLNNFDQTLANLVFNNIGGHTGNSSGMGPNVRTGSGTLMLTGGVTASSISNTSTIATINGSLLLPAGQHVFSVAPNSNVAQQVGLSLNSLTSGAGGIDLSGGGVFAITNTNTYTGATNVAGNSTLVLGGVREDYTNDGFGSIQASRLDVAAGSTVDMRGGIGYIGSLSGAGTVTNSVYGIINNTSAGNAATLFIGFDGTTDGNFSGRFTNFINGINETTGFGLSVTKVGAGTQTISGDNAAAITNAAANGDVNNTATLTIADGAVVVSGANGSLGFGTIDVRAGATLTLDNSAAVKANRLGGYRLTDSATNDTLNDATTVRAITMNGGTINFNAGASLMNEGTSDALSMASNPGVGTVTLASGASTWNFNQGTTSGVTIEVNAMTAGAGSLWLNAGGSQTLGRAAAGANSINVYVAGGMVAPQLQGSGALTTGAPVAAAAGLVGGNFSGIGIRPDITGTDSTGTGFVTYDRYGYRLLTTSEYGAFPVQPDSPLTTGGTNNPINPAASWAAPNLTGATALAGTSAAAASGAAGPTTITLSVANAAQVAVGQTLGGAGVPGGVVVTAVDYATGAVTISPWTASAAVAANQNFNFIDKPNVLVTEAQNFTTNNTIGSIRLDDGGGLISAGGSIPSASCATQLFNALGTLNTLTVATGDVLANAGNTGITGGAISSGGAALRFNVASGATLNDAAYSLSTGVGNALIKEGAGTLNLNRPAYIGSSTDAGATVVNGGTLNLLAGPNTLTVINSAANSLFDNLTINAGGTVDMKGFDQTIGTLASVDTLPGGGGTLTNSGAPANLYVNGNGTFGGSITGAINFYKTGANNQVLTSASTYTGTTTAQGGLLLLQDSGTLASTTYNIYGGQLRFENRVNASLSEISQRIPTGSTINMKSGTVMDLGRALDMPVTFSFSTVNVQEGINELRVDSGLAENRTMRINALNLTPGAQVHFATGAGTLGQIGASPNIVWDNFSPGTMMINGVIPWAVSSTDQPAMYNPVINPATGLAYGVAVPNIITNAAVSYTGTNAAAAAGAAGPTSITVTPAQAATIAVGTYLTGTGVPGGVLVTGVNTGTGAITLVPWTATAAVAANQAFTYTGGTANYQGTSFTAATTTQNINLAAAATISEAAVTTSRVFNSLRFSSTTATTVNMARQETLRLEAGLIISRQSNLTINNGFVTGGVTSNTNSTLYLNPVGNTLAINSQIVNNGTGVVSLVKGAGAATGGTGTLALAPAVSAGGSGTGAASNATVVGSMTLNLSAGLTTAPPVGAKVYGPGIPNGATVTAVAGPVITLSAPAIATTNGGVFGFGDAQAITGTNAAVANGAAGFTTLTVTNAQAATLYAGATALSAGMSTTIASIGAADSGGAGLTIVTLAAWTASAAVAANTAISYGAAAGVNTNNAYTGTTIVNQGTLALNGAAGNRSLGTNSSLTVNNTGIVTMTNAGQFAATTDLTINGGGVVTFVPVTVVEPATGQINAINSLTFNNSGGTTQPQINPGAAGILTVKSGLITSNSENQGSAPLVGGGAGAIINFGQVSLGSWASGATTVVVSDPGGFVAGQTVSGSGIAAGTTISSISGNTITLSTATTAGSAASGSLLAAVNHASGSTSAMTPTLAVNTTNPNELSADLVVSAVIANSPSWTNLAGGGAALQKTGNGNLVLSGQSTFNNGFALAAGSLTLGASSTPTTGVVTSGPLGTGTLTISGGTSIQSDSTVRTVANSVVVAGDFTVGGQQAGNSVVLNGTVDLGAANRNITVTSPQVTATLGGVVSGTGGLTKSGDGILVLNGANNYTGSTTINGGLLTTGNASALGATTNDLTVKCNAALNVNGQSLSIDGLTGDDATHGGLITNTGAAASLTIGSNNEATATFAGTITNTANALSVVKTGAGTQTLTGINTYTGTTTVSAGVLQVGTEATGTSSTLGSGAVAVNGGTLAGTGHVLAPAAGSTMTINPTGMLAPGDNAGASNGNLTLGSVAGSGLAPLPVTTAAASPSSVAGAVNLTVNDGGQIRLGITSPTLVSNDIITQLSLGAYVDAATTYAGLAATEQQRWNGQAWTQQSTGLVGSTTLSYTGLASAIGLGNVAGNGSLYVGQPVSGPGIAPGTVIQSITTGANPSVTLSSPIIATSTALTLNGSSIQNVNVIEGQSTIVLADVSGLAVGNSVSGYGIPANAVIASIGAGNTITLADSVTGGALVPLASTYAPTVSFAGPGSYDHLTITGTLALATGTATDVVKVVDNGFVATAQGGSVFNLLDWATLTSGWTSANLGTNFRVGGDGGGDLDLPALGGGLLWDVSLFNTHGVVVVVPEPGRAMLLLLGLLGILSRRRRRVE